MKPASRAVPMFIGSLVLLLGVGIERVFAQQASVTLFDARPTFRTGPQTSPSEAFPFASTTLILSFAPGDTAVISSTPDGTGPLVIDNFMTINGVNVCEGLGGPFLDSCFGPFLQDPLDPGVIGMPIETVRMPVPPIDVRGFVPEGTQTVLFELRDFGIMAGNTDLFLVTTGTIRSIGTTFGPPSAANPSGTFAESVNTATGNYLFQRTDLTIPRRRLPVVFTRTYNSLGTEAGPFGHRWTHSYHIFLTETPDGTVIITHGDGHEEFYTPAEGGTYQSLFGGVFNLFVKNPDGTFTLTLQDQTRYEFAASGQLIRMSDRHSNTLHFEYSVAGNLVAIADTVDRLVLLTYDSSNRIVQLDGPLGQVVQYSYDADGDLVVDVDPIGAMVHYDYDAAHRIIRIIDQRDNTLVVNSYDTAGRVVSQTNGRNFTTTFVYGVPQPSDTSIIDPRGNTTIHMHDNQLRLIQVTNALKDKAVFTYDANNNRPASLTRTGTSPAFPTTIGAT